MLDGYSVPHCAMIFLLLLHCVVIKLMLDDYFVERILITYTYIYTYI